MKINHLCVFCGASQGNNSVFRASAVSLGSELAKNKIQLIYGGGSSGLMGFLANSVLASGGEVTGVIPQHLKDRELGHHGLTKLEVVDNMHQRKERMFELADGIVVLPGGVGTLEEVLEIITWKQLGLHKKPIIFLNIMGYWENFYNLIKVTVEQGFANEQTQNLYISIDAPECLIPTLENL